MTPCPQCNEPFEHGPAPRGDLCPHCYWAREVQPLESDVDRYRGGRGISPLGHTGESFAYAMWQQKRAQIEAWQAENGLDVPVALLDECEDWRRIWQAKFHQEMRDAKRGHQRACRGIGQGAGSV